MAAAEERAERPEPAAQEEQRVEEDFGALLADTERERDEYLELAKRTKADFENYRKRVAKESQQAEARGRAQVAADILNVADSLERAIEVGAGSELLDGVKLVYNELSEALKRAGAEAYEPLGEQFDPEWHEAMLTQPVGDDQDGRVVQVLSKGYRLDGQVLRPARVAVGKTEGA